MKNCERCDKPILGAEVIELQGQHYHRECFQDYEASYRRLANAGDALGMRDNIDLRSRIAEILPQRSSRVRHVAQYPTHTYEAPAFTAYCWQRFLALVKPCDRLVLNAADYEWWRPAVSGAMTVLKLSYMDYPEEFEDVEFVARVVYAVSRTTGVQFLHIVSPQLIRQVYWDTNQCCWVNRSRVIEGVQDGWIQ